MRLENFICSYSNIRGAPCPPPVSAPHCTVVVSFSAWEQEGAKPAVGGLRPACIPIGAAGVSVARERRPAKPTRSMLGRASPLASGQLASEEHDSVAHWAA